MPIQYNPQSLEDSVAPIPALSIYISADPSRKGPISSQAGNVTSPEKRNNWSLHISINNAESIQLDTIVGPGDVLLLEVSHQPDRGSVKRIDLSIPTELSVESIITVLRKHKHDCYRFAPGGRGTRHWMKTTLALLFSVGYLLDEYEVQQAKKALEEVWAGQDQPVASKEQAQMEIGTFFDPDEADSNL
ncbi:hypothetical protein GLAREA_01758 [Glarea lozoyensis ATCC 20868]|uniref:DUF7770 domain-containing protein n=1 Tax=Glarea lozoyensis (strain ATCC 20868 / MF5171) TaxID=1116229 RepID=S3D1F5_GLAL2|nr:uncharacterized protein GLAREA_01758 [Glarea lozoyensis ATCC 20868]EPE25846.1 hypothetical protein GLAREA_01758 [Glarea lozoyensis ATCC 20868]